MPPRLGSPIDDRSSRIESALQQLADGELALFYDEFRDVGVVGTPAQTVNSEQMNFFTAACRGIIYVGVSASRLRDLSLPTLPHSAQGPANLHVPVDLRDETTTGISAGDRAATARALLDDTVSGADFLRPGHITPVALDPGGSLGRPGLPEAFADFVTAVGGRDGVAFCAVLDDDGRMAGAESLEKFAAEHDLPIVTIADAVRLRRRREGWPGIAREEDEIDLPFLGVRAVIHTRGSGRYHEELPVFVHQLCPESNLAPASCDCAARLAGARSRHEGLEGSALVLWWWRHDLGGRAAHEDDPPGFVSGLADLVAARAVGGYATPSEL